MLDILMTRPERYDAYTLHKSVYATLAGPGQARRFLFADLGGAVLVRGELTGDLAARGRPLVDVEAGREYRFALTAQPTVKYDGKRRSLGRSRSKDDLRLRWIGNRGRDHGFSIVGMPVMTTRNVTIDKGEKTFGINLTTYEGRLRVTDAGALRAALVGGIGRGRTYGAGLLILSPLS